MAIDVERVRAETPGLLRGVHLNHAGASPSPEPVLDAVIGHLRREAEVGGYEAAAERDDDLRGVYRSVARLIGCGADEVALTESATRAWELAFWSLPLGPGDVVVTTSSEYVSNALSLLLARERLGVEVEVLPDGADGAVDPAALTHRLEQGPVALVALTYVPTSGGLVNPAAEVGAICRAAGVPYLLDACQAAGQLPLDVEELGCDLLSATGRKFLRGPRGTGFLYVRAGILDRLRPPFIDAGSAIWTGPDTYEVMPGATRFEAWERSWANQLGLGAAVDYALALGLGEIAGRVGRLAEDLRAGLASVPGVTVRDRGTRRCGIVTFTVEDHAPARVRERLAAHGVRVWTVPDVAAQLDLGRRGLPEVVRASVHYTTTDDELDLVTRLVADLARA
ncbi:MAG: aminotransferase class V-fold PLP-dependent enzyme [Microthrixaceae bacterium]